MPASSPAALPGLVDADVAEHGLPRQSLTPLFACLLVAHGHLILLLLTGSTFLIWFGPTPRLAVADPDLIREILLSRAEHFDRYESHPMVRQLEGEGLVSLRGEKWAHHRRVLAPTFHMENLKVGRSLGPLLYQISSAALASFGIMAVMRSGCGWC